MSAPSRTVYLGDLAPAELAHQYACARSALARVNGRADCLLGRDDYDGHIRLRDFAGELAHWCGTLQCYVDRLEGGEMS